MMKWLLILICSLLLIGCTQKQNYLTVGQVKLAVEIRDTDKERQQGLSGRNKLGENEGMLFVFDKPGRYGFWMKEMKFPLDFVWILSDTVMEVTENVDINRMDLRPKTTIDKVLEVNSGWVKENNIKVGDKIKP